MPLKGAYTRDIHSGCKKQTKHLRLHEFSSYISYGMRQKLCRHHMCMPQTLYIQTKSATKMRHKGISMAPCLLCAHPLTHSTFYFLSIIFQEGMGERERVARPLRSDRFLCCNNIRRSFARSPSRSCLPAKVHRGENWLVSQSDVIVSSTIYLSWSISPQQHFSHEIQ